MAETRIEVLQDWLDELQQPRKPLTKWELSFLESITDQLSHGRANLTEKQAETLERIYSEKT